MWQWFCWDKEKRIQFSYKSIAMSLNWGLKHETIVLEAKAYSLLVFMA
jgi:hypothetical protein